MFNCSLAASDIKSGVHGGSQTTSTLTSLTPSIDRILCSTSTGSDPSFSAAFSVYKRYTQDTPRPFSTLLDEASWMDPDRGLEVIAGSGLVSVEVITRRLTGTYQSAAAAVQWALAWPLTAEGCQQLPFAACEALRAEALVAVEATGQLEWYRDVHYYRAKAATVSA